MCIYLHVIMSVTRQFIPKRAHHFLVIVSACQHGFRQCTWEVIFSRQIYFKSSIKPLDSHHESVSLFLCHVVRLIICCVISSQCVRICQTMWPAQPDLMESYKKLSQGRERRPHYIRSPWSDVRAMTAHNLVQKNIATLLQHHTNQVAAFTTG